MRWFARAGSRVVVLAIALALLISLSGCFGGDDSKPDGIKVDRIGKAVERGSDKLGELVASPQRVSGSYVVIDKVTLPSGGYVAVYADGNGAPGRVLGVSDLLEDGTSKNVRIKLTPKITSRTVVHAMLHSEDNKNKTFDFPKHDAPIGSKGGVVEAAFKVEVK